MERGVDGITAVILVSMLPVLPLILGVGLFYELFSRLDTEHRLSTHVHWALASGATLILIFGIAYLMFSSAAETTGI